MKIKVDELEVIISDKQTTDVNRIKKIIKNNYELLSGFTQDNIIDISDDDIEFEKFFNHIANVGYNSEYVKEYLNDANFLSVFYILTLARSIRHVDTTHNNIVDVIMKGYANISDEQLTSLIAYKYFETNGTFSEFIEYLKYRENYEKIFEWFKNTYRWDAYNWLLNVIVTSLKITDKDIIQQMEYIVSIWDDRTIKYLTSANKEKNLNKSNIKISNQEFDNLIYEFFQYINAPTKWANIYNNLKEKGLIIKEEDADCTYSQCKKDSDGIYKIFIGNGNNIEGFYNFIHEFIHYISIEDALLVKKIVISEVPSIFFEYIAVEFLKEKGYTSEISSWLSKERELNNYEIYISQSNLYDDLIAYIKHGKVTTEHKILMYKKQIELIEQLKSKKAIYIDEKEYNIEKDINKACDETIILFIREGLRAISGYQYLYATYINEQILQNRNANTIDNMIYIAENLGKLHIKDISALFEYNIPNKKRIK